MQRLQDLPFLLRRLFREMTDPQRTLPLVIKARVFIAVKSFSAHAYCAFIRWIYLSDKDSADKKSCQWKSIFCICSSLCWMGTWVPVLLGLRTCVFGVSWFFSLQSVNTCFDSIHALQSVGLSILVLSVLHDLIVFDHLSFNSIRIILLFLVQGWCARSCCAFDVCLPEEFV